MVILALIIVCIIIWVTKEKEVKKLWEENKRLNEKVKQYESLTHETGIKNPVKEIVKPENVQSKKIDDAVVQNIKDKEEKLKIKEKEKNDDKKTKNTMILFTGAFCIVLAAIVFLVSTWAAIPNLLKTLVLVMVTGIFFVLSNVAKKKYDLPKASKVFYYIGMAYIPICLGSISIFKLFGEYLSFTGEGRYLYLLIASLVMAIIYYCNRKEKGLLVGSILSQVLAVISFSLILSDSAAIIGISLLLYNILLMFIAKDSVFGIVNKVIPWVILPIALVNLFEITLSTVFINIVLAINYLILYLRTALKVHAYMFNGIAVLSIISLSIFGIEENKMLEWLIFCLVILIYIVQNIVLAYKRNGGLVEASTLVTSATLTLFYFITANVPEYVISLSVFGIYIYYYSICNKKLVNFVECILPITFIISGINALESFGASYHLNIIFAFVVYIISELLKKKQPSLYIKTNIISHIYMIIAILINSIIIEWRNDTIYYAILLAIYAYSYITNKKIIFKYASYVTGALTLYSLLTLLGAGTQAIYYVPMVITLLFTLIEIAYKKQRNLGNNIYLSISEAISFILMYNLDITPGIKNLVILISGALIALATYNKATRIPHFISLACIMPAIFNNELGLVYSNIMMLIAVAILTAVSIKHKSWSLHTIASAAYILQTMMTIENKYINLVALLIWGVVHLLFADKEDRKDIFKLVSYIATFILYNVVIADFSLNQYTVFSVFGYLALAIIIFKTLLLKRVKSVSTLNVFEYITYGIIYFVALTMYTGELDGIWVASLLILVIFASYIKKYIALFMTTTIALILNIFILTRTFWFSVPWWIYLLVAGAILITFAISNEIGDKKGNRLMDKIFKKLKETNSSQDVGEK